jgi:hypothetical protein
MTGLSEGPRGNRIVFIREEIVQSFKEICIHETLYPLKNLVAGLNPFFVRASKGPQVNITESELVLNLEPIRV